MAKDETTSAYDHGKKVVYNNGSNAVYGLGLFGALFYFLPQATTFQEGVLGILKALVWPAILIYKLLEFLKL